VQIVDARNPLLFRCEDLESYVKEIDSKKMNIILINKSDFLSLKQRVAWLRYFESQKIKVVFWSAVLAANEGKEPGDAHDDKKSLSDIHEERSHNENELEGEEDIEEEDEDGDDDDDAGDENELETTTESNKFQLLDEEKEESFVIVEKADMKDENKNSEVKNSEDEEDDDEESEEIDAEDEIEHQKDQLQQQPDEKKIEDKIADMKIAEKEDEESGEFSAEEIEKCNILTREELIALFKKKRV
jgi:large subunit GTPase 1